MSYPTLTANTFYETRRELCVLAKVMVLDVVHLTQSKLLQVAVQRDIPDALCRLVKSDIAEAILAKEAKRVAQTQEYQALSHTDEREEMLEHALFGALLGWVTSRASPIETSKLLQGALELYTKPGSDSRA